MKTAYYINDIERKYKIHPKMFLLYLSMASMIMLFSAFSSALIVKKGDIKNWQEVLLPNIFGFSTLVIVLSSFTLHEAWKRVNSLRPYKLFLWLTLGLSLGFLVLQYLGWKELKVQNVLYTGNPSGTFIYFISGVHLFHYVFGIFFLIILGLNSSNKVTDTFSLNFKILTHYWHFIGLVWVYLFILFKFIIYK